MFALLLATLLTTAPGTPEGIGLLHGRNHAFSFQAPPGWVLDNQSGLDIGLHAVFYPVGQTWRDSPVMAYAKVFTITPEVATPEALVADTLADFRPDSPLITATFKKSLTLADGRSASLYHFTGDKFGNYEAVAYIKERVTINFFVLSSRDKKHFTSSLTAFEALVRSYRFVSEHVEYSDSAHPQ
jgi:hypothetical protein